MPSRTPWKYFDKSLLPAYVRRRARVGRAEVSPLEWKDKLHGVLPDDWRQQFMHDVIKSFEWLCPEVVTPELWSLWALSNGGLYFAPCSHSKFRLNRPDRSFDELVSAEAAGLVATLFALSSRRSNLMEPAPARLLKTLDKSLMAFARVHPECAELFAVMD